MKRHLLSHSNEKPHKCPHCTKAYKSKEYLYTHMKRHDNIVTPYLCEYEDCDRSFEHEKSLKIHVREWHRNSSNPKMNSVEATLRKRIIRIVHHNQERMAVSEAKIRRLTQENNELKAEIQKLLLLQGATALVSTSSSGP